MENMHIDVRVLRQCHDGGYFLIKLTQILFLSGSCRRRTTSRYCCAFPFIYKGRRYNSCTRRKHNRPWCATTPNYDRDRQWGNCGGKRLGNNREILTFLFFCLTSVLNLMICLLVGRRKPVKPVKPIVRPPRGQLCSFIAITFSQYSFVIFKVLISCVFSPSENMRGTLPRLYTITSLEEG